MEMTANFESERRLQRAICGAKPDRVPVSPLLYYFAATHAGIPFVELVNEPPKYREAIEKCWEDFGPWDVYYPLNAVNRDMMALAMPMKNAYPGDELDADAQVQFLEEELMLPEDYKLLLEPSLKKESADFRKALRRELNVWLKSILKNGSLDSVARFSEYLPDLVRNAYGDVRNPAENIRRISGFAKTMRRLHADPELDTDLCLRYLRFIIRIASRARGRSGTIDNVIYSALAAYEQLDFTQRDVEQWRKRGVATLFGMGLEGPFDSFSMARSMMPFSMNDIFDKPSEIRECCLNAVDFFVVMAELGVSLTGVPRFIYACHRTSNDFISPTHFRELAFPAMREITEKLNARGITVVFHCDGNWDLNLECIATLPEGACVFQFDGRTDTCCARRVLGEGHCIFGDAPAAMLAFGDETEVTEYCRKLIREVGANGRFILGAGCEIPPDAKPENVRALIRAPFETQ